VRNSLKPLTFILFTFSLCSSAELPGTISGTVVNERGQPVAATQVSIDPLDNRPRADLVRMVETDRNGHFVMNDLELGSYKVFAMKEDSGYPNTSFAFYSNHVFPTATLTAGNPVADVIVAIGPPAGVVKGSVKDRFTNKPISASFLLRRASNPDNWISLGQPPEYRVLIPPSTEVWFEVSAPGYKTSYYGGRSDALKRSPIRLGSHQKTEIDIQLEPEEQSKR
jgi:Carboxypeptidase regulatory-like domain